MFGQIDIEITLAPPGVLALGKSTEAVDLAAVAVGTSEIGIAIPSATKVAAAVAAEGTNINYLIYHSQWCVMIYLKL